MDQDNTEKVEAPKAKPFSMSDIPDDAVNLLPFMLKSSDEKMKKYLEDEPERLYKLFNELLEGRSGWMAKAKDRIKLWLGDIEPKKEPFKNAANLHEPILLEKTLRLAFRLHAELFKDGKPVFNVEASNQGMKERAALIKKHLNWQFTREMRDFQMQVLISELQFFRDGEMLFYSWRDMENEVNCHRALSCEEFVYSYTDTTSSVDMSDVPHKFLLTRRYKRELKKMARSGYYDATAVEEVITREGSREDELDQPIKDLVDKYQGKAREDHGTDSPYLVPEYFGWTQLPGEDDEIPVKIAFDIQSKKLLGFWRRDYDDPEDKLRFEKQMGEMQQYDALAQQYVQAMQAEQELTASLNHPAHDPQEVAHTLGAIQRERPQPPPMPPWMKVDEVTQMHSSPEPVKTKIIEPFTHAVCIPNPDGSHGIGFGNLLTVHQMAANIMLNQAVDQATLNNSFTAIMYRNAKLPKGMTTIEPGSIVPIDNVPLDSMDKAIVPIRPGPANPQLLEGVKLQHEAADSISSAPDVLSGEKEGAETFRGQATRVEQAVRQLAVPAGAFVLALSNIARNQALLNSQFLPDYQLVAVIDPETRQTEQIDITRDIYRESYFFNVASDLRFSSRASEIAETDDVLGMLTKGVPPQIASLVLKPEIFAWAIRNCLRARGLPDGVLLVLTDQEIQQKLAEQAQQAAAQQAAMAGAPPPGLPPGRPGPAPQPAMPPKAIPTGQPNATPGGQPPQPQRQQGVPTQAHPQQ